MYAGRDGLLTSGFAQQSSTPCGCETWFVSNLCLTAVSCTIGLEDPDTFSAGKTMKSCVYYRGGNEAAMLKAVNAAFDRPKQTRD